MELDNDEMCFVCGKRNPDGLRLDFHLEGERGVRTSFTPPKKFQGWRDLVHGGIIATILDEVMVNVVYLRGSPAVTGRMALRLRRPARVGERLTFRAEIVKETGRAAEVRARAELDDGTLIAEATGLVMKMAAPGQAPGP